MSAFGGFRFLVVGSAEWDEAWASLGQVLAASDLGDGSDLAQEDPQSGEVWQYMGTYQGFHEFRHRWHPKAGRRMYAKVQEVPR